MVICLESRLCRPRHKCSCHLCTASPAAMGFITKWSFSLLLSALAWAAASSVRIRVRCTLCSLHGRAWPLLPLRSGAPLGVAFFFWDRQTRSSDWLWFCIDNGGSARPGSCCCDTFFPLFCVTWSVVARSFGPCFRRHCIEASAFSPRVCGCLMCECAPSGVPCAYVAPPIWSRLIRQIFASPLSLQKFKNSVYLPPSSSLKSQN